MTMLPQQSVYGDDPRSEVQAMIPTDARTVLDVGCGEGGFGRTLRSTLGPSARIIGLDAVARNAELSRQNKGYDSVIEGYFPDAIAESQETYDLITFLDVLEHMFDPWATLTRSHELLNPGGRVLAVIPNVRVWTLLRDLVRGRWDYTTTGILDRTHVRFFTRATMLEMFESSGFVIESCEGINSQKIPLRPVRRVLNRRLAKDMKWLPYILPDSAWLQYAIVAGKRG